MTCEHYNTCDKIRTTIADKATIVDRSRVCTDYEPDREMSLYIRKNYIKKAEKQE